MTDKKSDTSHAPGKTARAADTARARRAARRHGGGEAASAGMSRELRTRIALVLLVLAVTVFFAGHLFGGLEFNSSDASAPAGFAKVGGEELARGVYPQWNPYMFCGMPSFGSLLYNPNVFTPDLILGAVTNLLHLPNDAWLVFYYLLMGLGFFWFLLKEAVAPEAALVGALALVFTPNAIAVGAFGHGSQMVDDAFIPFALLGTAELFRKPRVGAVGGLALALGLSFMRAHIQIFYYTLLLVGLYALVHSITTLLTTKDGKRVGLALGGLVVAIGLAGMMGAVLALPVQDYAAHSIRAAGPGGGMSYSSATGWSMLPKEIWTFLVPSALGFGGATYWGTMPFTDYPNYMGLGVFVLALLGLVFARRYRVFFGVTGVLSLLFALGKHSALYNFAYAHLPYFNKFRVPVMILILLQVAVAALAAFMLSRAAEAHETEDEGERRRLGRLLVGAGAVVGVLGFGFLVLRGAFEGGYVGAAAKALAARGLPPGQTEPAARMAWDLVGGDLPRVTVLAVAMLLASGFYALRKLPRLAWMVILVVAVCADLWVVDKKLIAPVVGHRGDRSASIASDDVIEFLTKQPGQFRIFPMDGRDFGDNKYSGYRIASIGGYHAAKPLLYDKLYTASNGFGNLNVLAMLNVEYLVSPQQLPPYPFLTLVHDGSRKVYKNALSLPRAWFVPAVQVVANDSLALAAVMDSTWNPRASAIVIDPKASTRPATLGPGDAQITQYNLNDIEMKTSAPQGGFLAISEAWYPDWTATVDGKPAELLQTNYMLRGLYLPAGEHTVRMEFNASSYRKGKALSTAGGLISLALLLGPLGWGLMRRKRAA